MKSLKGNTKPGTGEKDILKRTQKQISCRKVYVYKKKDSGESVSTVVVLPCLLLFRSY